MYALQNGGGGSGHKRAAEDPQGRVRGVGAEVRGCGSPGHGAWPGHQLEVAVGGRTWRRALPGHMPLGHALTRLPDVNAAWGPVRLAHAGAEPMRRGCPAIAGAGRHLTLPSQRRPPALHLKAPLSQVHARRNVRPAGRVCPGLQSVRETARDQADEVPEAAQVPSCLAPVPRESISLVQMPNCPKLTEGGARALLLKLQCPGLRMGLPRSGQSSAFLLLSPAVGPRQLLPVVPWLRPRPALCPVEGPALFQLHCQ